MNWKPVCKITDTENGTRLVVINQLYNMPLYAFYVVELMGFEEGDIEGTLMTPPFEFYGPFTTEEEARTMVDDLQ